MEVEVEVEVDGELGTGTWFDGPPRYDGELLHSLRLLASPFTPDPERWLRYDSDGRPVQLETAS